MVKMLASQKKKLSGWSLQRHWTLRIPAASVPLEKKKQTQNNQPGKQTNKQNTQQKTGPSPYKAVPDMLVSRT